MGLTVAPTNFWFLGWVAMIPLWMGIKKESLSETLLSCFAWGCGYHGLALFWITGIHPMTWMGVSWFNSILIALFAWIFITFWGAGLVVSWGAIFYGFIVYLSSVKKSSIYLFWKILLGIMIWCLLEKVWSFSPLWWSSISYSQSPYNLSILQFLKLSGITIVTSLLILVNSLLAEGCIAFKGSKYRYISFFKDDKKKYLSIPLGFFLLILFHGIGYFWYVQPIFNNPNEIVKVGIIQGNIPNTIKLYESGVARAIARYTKSYETLSQEGVDLIITPETAIPLYLNDIKTKTNLYSTILKQNTPLILGAFGKKENNFTNSLFLIDPPQNNNQQYDKIKLVPLGEYIPLGNILGKFINRLSPLDAHLIAGEKHQTFITPFGKAIVGICYESAYGEHFRAQTNQGGQFIITSSNNAHYSQAMPSQHHAQDVMRAIENDRWMARATNTGYSGIVDPHGNTIWRSDINQYQTYKGDIYRRQTQTPYVRWGDWLNGLFVIILTGLLIYCIII
ncbi:apolipoprotein N-acyltransferase [Cyanobacterium stanieri LEGE 03274]|uniref:Apolipoprotein N-acyltransferase n=1 Tax=Cyanobacterium stanieri LEGE 03274 TaxID=1828756 RepID=A0ABR9V283_9CHRO|nr:apolipoprotein N-acyltransferase [Cyanobacterium stanieri]MBE9221987.1 apolipoprotein N-acyltransferase [Cyanobacterium stanieri LEGE 03274]